MTPSPAPAPPTERIVAAAIDQFDLIVTLMPPARHYTLIDKIAHNFNIGHVNGQQGFLTSTGRFVSRSEAYLIAHANGQCRDKGGDAMLFSEDLW